MLKFDDSRSVISQIVRDVVDNTNYPVGSWKNKPIQITDKFSLSIQAGEYYYCNPKGNFKLNSDYQEYEVGLLCFKNDCWSLFQPRKIFSQYYWADLFEHGNNPVAGYLTESEIADMVKDIIRVSPLIHFHWIDNF